MTIQRLAHGGYSLIPTFLTMVGWLLALFQDGCDYVKVTGPIVNLIATQPNAPYIEAGRNAYREPKYDASNDSWSTEFYGTCLIYPTEHITMDIYWNMSKLFDFISIVLGGTGTLFLWFSACCIFSRGTWKLAGVQVLLSSIFQGLSFLFLLTDLCQQQQQDEQQQNTCSMYYGSWSDVASTILFFMAFLFIIAHYPIPKTDQYYNRNTIIDTHGRDGIMVISQLQQQQQQQQYNDNIDDDHHHNTREPYSDHHHQQQEQQGFDDDYYEKNKNPVLTEQQQQQPVTTTTTTTPGEQNSGEGSGEEGPLAIMTNAQIV